MRILLAQNALYYPAYGGGDRSNRLLLEALAARGHACRVVARIARFGATGHAQYLRELAARAVAPVSSEEGAVLFKLAGVEAHVVTGNPNLRAYFAAQIAAFDPDVILTSTDDPAQLLLEVAVRSPAPTIFLARATLALPFGPDCAFPSAAKTEALRQAAGVVGVSRYVADYILKWSGIPASHVPISLPDPPPYPDLGGFENEFVTLVNPCAVKGISIFLALADRMPGVKFAGVPTWGTTQADRAALAGRANVTLLDPVDNVDGILRRTRVLLVPSLWAEARSRMVVEAMLRGVPVIASRIGGIPEAKLGVDYLLPVRPIERYHARLDEQMVPLAELPEQDIGPWQAALDRLITDRAHYEALARASRQAALTDAAQMSVRPFEALLEHSLATPGKGRASADRPPGSPADGRNIEGRSSALSSDRQKLLALRLRRISAARPVAAGALRLFCFPHAGGGPAAFKDWPERLPASVVVVPMRPPRPLKPADMAGLVAAWGDAIEPYLNEPFAFFGHSMGAIVAFEVARLLRRRNRPAPRMLVASGARAPHFRRGHVPPPEPSEAEFVEALRHLEGTPREVLDDPRLMQLILPALREDAAIYRHYIYTEEPPLDCPIRAYGGAQDPNVQREHLEGWAAETTAASSVRVFPGGHFYLRARRDEVLASLARDLSRGSE
ncbi:MAG: thioesterase domain-containing protein [Bryobacteraceae bacterium]|jgi:surfactin synthase thioesterase subunit/glycosyltransferase involved in cell wall biosynthesis